jgi:hypothetical protein
MDCCGEHWLTIVQEEHAGTLNLDTEAMVGDKMQDREQVVLEQRDIEDTGEEQQAQ